MEHHAKKSTKAHDKVKHLQHEDVLGSWTAEQSASPGIALCPI